MKKCLIDTNIFLDVILKRPKFYKNSKLIILTPSEFLKELT